MPPYGTNNCIANLTAGFIDLATYDELEKYLYGGPYATVYFIRETRKSTWFTQVPVTLQYCEGTPQFGSDWSVSITRAGDYLLGTWLHVSLPEISVLDWKYNNSPFPQTEFIGPSYYYFWTPNFMHALIKECCISFNDLVAARFTSTHLDFWSVFTTPAAKAGAYYQMIGGSIGSAGGYIPPQNLNLPLPFFYTRDSGVALPTAALPYNEMRIQMTFRPIEELLLCLQLHYPEVGCKIIGSDAQRLQQNAIARPIPLGFEKFSVGDYSNIKLIGQIWANYAIVSNEERKRMACAPRDILIEQFQDIAETEFIVKGGQALEQAYSVKFSHALKVLFFGAKNVNIPGIHSLYSTGVLEVGAGSDVFYSLGTDYKLANPPKPKLMCPVACRVLRFQNIMDPIAAASLVYENTQRLGLMSMDYYDQVNPWYCAGASPSQLSPVLGHAGYHMYSYSLDFLTLDPLGSTNYGKLTNIILNIISRNLWDNCGTYGTLTFNGNMDLTLASSSALFENFMKYYSAWMLSGPHTQWDAVVVADTQTLQKFNTVILGVNNNIIRISGGSLGFPIL